MGKPRNWYTYTYIRKGKALHGGRTQNLEEREMKHQQKWPEGHIKEVGRAKTKESAIKWEKDHGYA